MKRYMGKHRIAETRSRMGAFMKNVVTALALVVALGCATTPKDDEPPAPVAATPEQRLIAEADRLWAAIGERPNDADLYYRLGNVLFDLGRYVQANQAYAQCLEIDPGRADALSNMGLTYRRIGVISEAYAHYDAALQIEPDDEITLFNLVSLLEEEGRYVEALEPMSHLYALRPDDVPTISHFADLLFRVGNFEDAAIVYRELVDYIPHYSIGWYRLGLCHYELQRLEETAAVWNAALAHDGRNANVLRGLPVLYWEMGDYSRAWAAVQQCQRLGIGLDPEFITELQRDSGQVGPE